MNEEDIQALAGQLRDAINGDSLEDTKNEVKRIIEGNSDHEVLIKALLSQNSGNKEYLICELVAQGFNSFQPDSFNNDYDAFKDFLSAIPDHIWHEIHGHSEVLRGNIILSMFLHGFSGLILEKATDEQIRAILLEELPNHPSPETWQYGSNRRLVFIFDDYNKAIDGDLIGKKVDVSKYLPSVRLFCKSSNKDLPRYVEMLTGLQRLTIWDRLYLLSRFQFKLAFKMNMSIQANTTPVSSKNLPGGGNPAEASHPKEGGIVERVMSLFGK